MTRGEKILVYNDHFFKVSQTFLYHQVKSLSETHEVHLLARSYSNPHDFENKQFKKHVISRAGNLFDRAAGKIIRKLYGTSLNIDFRSFLTLRRLLRNNRFKAVHAHFGPRALELLGFARRFQIPLIVTFHGYDASQMLSNRKYTEKLPELFDYASGIIIVSGHMMETLRLKPWLEKVHVIPCAIDPAEFVIDDEQKNGSAVLKILHSGRIVGKKGVPDLIQVFRELAESYSHIELHLVGDGNELDRCKKLVAEYGLEEKVTFYGAVSHSKVKTLLNEADIFVLNSRTDENGDMEGTPVSILEAMCMGKAVVSTKHAGIPYVIEHGKDGLLAMERSNDELKACLEKLIKNPEVRNKMGTKAIKKAREAHNVHLMQQKIKKVFEAV